MRRKSERRDNMLFVAPLREERAFDDVPIALEHRGDQRRRTQTLQARPVAGIIRLHARIVIEPGRDVLPQHPAFGGGHAPDRHRLRADDEGVLDEQMPDVAGVGGTQDPGELADILRREHDADHAHAVAQETVHLVGEVRQLVDQQDVDFRALVFVDIVLCLAVTEIDHRAVPEPDLVTDDPAPAAKNPHCEQRAKAFRAFKMVLVQILANASEQVDLQACDSRAPDDRGDPHQVRLARSCGAAEQDLSRLG